MFLSSFLKKFLVVGSFLSAIISYHYLPQALSIFDVAITMNRNQAIEASQKIITAEHFLPEGYEHAAYFDGDTKLQYYIELAAGGKKVFKELLEGHTIEPYRWVVRWYKEGETQEVTFAFTASGVPYSFSKKVPELEEAPSLSEAEARKRAEAIANKWNINFSLYKSFEYSKEERPSKRIDHIFTYQRDDISLGDEGKYRVKIIVSGDTVTTVYPFVFIPESFVRRYEEMRAENNTITIVASSFYNLLYLFGAIILLGALLLYRRQLQYKYALIVALVLSIGVLGTLLSQWPFLFIDYNTALSKNSMLVMCCLDFSKKVIITFLTTFLFTTVVYGIDKWAFPKHESIWNFFSLERAARRRMLWYVLGAYLGTFIKLAAVTGTFLFLTGSWVQWWAPASNLVNPNILALGIPWLDPIISSFNAGFIEELLFRAIPLSAALLLGRFFRREQLFIVLGLCIQALVFTALHANYPMYPAYFRIVEMFPGALVYGILYLKCGLIPGIILHWLYDLLMMSLPIMVSTASGMLFQKIMILIIAFFPLCYVVYARYIFGYKKDELEADVVDKQDELKYEQQDENDLNNKNIVAAFNLNYDEGKSFFEQISLSKKLVMVGVLGAFLGGLGYKIYLNLSHYSKVSIVSKSVVCKDSYERLVAMDSDFAERAKQLYCLESHANSNRQRSSFAWRTTTPETYFSLADRYVYPLSWTVRYARFDGTQAERAEEYIFMYGKSGELLRYVHSLSDQISGKELDENQARKRVLTEIKKWYNIDIDILKEISSESVKKPSRLDWNFTFEDTSIVLEQGSARIGVALCGDELASIGRYIFVPETWIRQLDQESLYVNMISSVLRVLFYLLVLIGIGYLKRPAIAIFDRRLFSTIVSIIVGVLFSCIYFRFSMIAYSFQTSVAWSNQVISYITPSVVFYIITSVLLSIGYLCYRYSWGLTKTSFKMLDTFLYGLLFGCMSYGMELGLKRYYPALGDPTILNSSYSILWFILTLGLQIFQAGIFIYLGTMALNKITHFGNRYRWLVPTSMFLCTLYMFNFSLFSRYYLIPLLVFLVLVSLLMTLLYYHAIRYDFFTYMYGYFLFVICNEIIQSPCTVSTISAVGLLCLIYFLYRLYTNRLVSY